MDTLKTITDIITVLGTVVMVLYFYQVLFIVVPFLVKPKPHKKTVINKIGVLISARNESNVIGQLIESIHNQDYPQNKIRIFVCADNCTDNTAELCRKNGAIVYERFNMDQVGKGFALNFMLGKIKEDFADDPCDAYIVLDADNVLEPNYISEMNKTYCDGYEIITSYRNSKNYGDSWISAGYALWFLRESQYLNNSRMLCNTSCAIGGTGFLVSKNVIDKYDGWNFFLLTEDIEFTVQNVIDGRKIGYCGNAVLYDEQPTTLKQSWIQRLRWSKGFLQICRRYSVNLFKSIFSKNFTSCADIFLVVIPSAFSVLGFFLLIFGILAAAILELAGVNVITDPLMLLYWAIKNIALGYGWLFLLGLITTITEWDNIHCQNSKKILYMFTFPIYLFTHVPITIHAFFKKVKWDPIVHKTTSTVSEIRKQKETDALPEKEKEPDVQ